jgi:hypothetical protein
VVIPVCPDPAKNGDAVAIAGQVIDAVVPLSAVPSTVAVAGVGHEVAPVVPAVPAMRYKAR